MKMLNIILTIPAFILVIIMDIFCALGAVASDICGHFSILWEQAEDVVNSFLRR